MWTRNHWLFFCPHLALWQKKLFPVCHALTIWLPHFSEMDGSCLKYHSKGTSLHDEVWQCHISESLPHDAEVWNRKPGPRQKSACAPRFISHSGKNFQQLKQNLFVWCNFPRLVCASFEGHKLICPMRKRVLRLNYFTTAEILAAFRQWGRTNCLRNKVLRCFDTRLSSKKQRKVSMCICFAGDKVGKQRDSLCLASLASSQHPYQRVWR